MLAQTANLLMASTKVDVILKSVFIFNNNVLIIHSSRVNNYHK